MSCWLSGKCAHGFSQGQQGIQGWRFTTENETIAADTSIDTGIVSFVLTTENTFQFNSVWLEITFLFLSNGWWGSWVIELKVNNKTENCVGRSSLKLLTTSSQSLLQAEIFATVVSTPGNLEMFGGKITAIVANFFHWIANVSSQSLYSSWTGSLTILTITLSTCRVADWDIVKLFMAVSEESRWGPWGIICSEQNFTPVQWTDGQEAGFLRGKRLLQLQRWSHWHRFQLQDRS